MFQHPRAGIAIGASHLRAVVPQGSRRRRGHPVAAAVPLPEGAVTLDGQLDSALLADGLRLLRDRLPGLRGPVWLALPEGLVIYRHLRLPRMSRAAVRLTVRLQAEQFMPFAAGVGRACFETQPAGLGEIAVLLTGVDAAVLNGLRAACRAAGLRLAGVTAPVIGLAPLAMQWSAGGDPEELVAVVTVADGRVNAYLFRDGVPLAARSLAAGRGEGAAVHFELRQSLTGHGRLPDRVLVLGEVDAAWLDGLRATLSRLAFGPSASPVTVTAAGPLPGELAGEYGVAFGLAELGRRGRGQPPALNLLDRRQDLDWPPPWRYPALVAGGAALLAGLYGLFWPAESERTAQAAALVRAVQAPPAAAPADLDRVERYRPALAALAQERSWTELVGGLLALQPPGLRVQTVSPEAGGTKGLTLQLQGTAGSYAQIDQFVQRLRGSGDRRVETQSVSRTADGLRFNLRLTVGSSGR